MNSRTKGLVFSAVAIVSVLGLMTVIDIGSVPDGWTRASWQDFKDRDPLGAKGIRFIQDSAKRRQVRDIYLGAFDEHPKILDGHVASVTITENQMTGEKMSTVNLEVLSLSHSVAYDIQAPTASSFSKSRIESLETQASKMDSSIRQQRAYLADMITEPYDEHKFQEGNTELAEMESSLTRIHSAIDSIKKIGD